jgi:hypothetical protein
MGVKERTVSDMAYLCGYSAQQSSRLERHDAPLCRQPQVVDENVGVGRDAGHGAGNVAVETRREGWEVSKMFFKTMAYDVLSWRVKRREKC